MVKSRIETQNSYYDFISGGQQKGGGLPVFRGELFPQQRGNGWGSLLKVGIKAIGKVMGKGARKAVARTITKKVGSAVRSQATRVIKKQIQNQGKKLLKKQADALLTKGLDVATNAINKRMNKNLSTAQTRQKLAHFIAGSGGLKPVLGRKRVVKRKRKVVGKKRGLRQKGGLRFGKKTRNDYIIRNFMRN